MKRPLTNQQQLVYDFIRDRILVRGYGPTVREIGEHMNIKSPNGVMCHLRALERKGMITRTANKSRAIELTEPISRKTDASVLVSGSVTAGVCKIESVIATDFDLAQFSGDNRYALRVLDDSLLDVSIRRGDLLLIQQQASARHGQLAVIQMSETTTCLRFWVLDATGVRLQPANRSLPSSSVEASEVQGVVVGVLRDLTLLDMPSEPRAS